MYRLYYHTICPFSRKVRMVLDEKKLPYELIQEDFWKRRHRFIAMNPSGKIPVLTAKPDIILQNSMAICEYLDEKYPDFALLAGTAEEKAEVRRLVAWADEKFSQEVSFYIIQEKVINFYKEKSQPDNNILRVARGNIAPHMQYLAYLLNSRKWIAGERISYADFAFAAHISILDYLNEINWSNIETVKDWYSLMKSRPSFRIIAQDVISGFNPPKHYGQVDF